MRVLRGWVVSMTAEREERLLARVEDAFGVISVYEVDDYRFLEFGDAIE